MISASIAGVDYESHLSLLMLKHKQMPENCCGLGRLKRKTRRQHLNKVGAKIWATWGPVHSIEVIGWRRVTRTEHVTYPTELMT